MCSHKQALGGLATAEALSQVTPMHKSLCLGHWQKRVRQTLWKACEPLPTLLLSLLHVSILEDIGCYCYLLRMGC